MSDNAEDDEPYAYIHIPPATPGGKFTRLLAPVKGIRKFDYKKYVDNKKDFQDKQFTYKNSEGNKVNCLVLEAADNLTSLQTKIRGSKRFHVPSVKAIVDVTLGNDSTLPQEQEEVIEEDHTEDVKRAKIERKKAKKDKEKSDQENCEEILKKYMQNALRTDDYVPTNTEDESHSPVFSLHSSTLLNDITNRNSGIEGRIIPLEPKTLDAPVPPDATEIIKNKDPDHSKCLAAINGYKVQTAFFEKKCKQTEAEAQQWKSKYEDLTKQTSAQSDSTLLMYYDKLYKYDGPFEIDEESSDTIKLLNDIECKTIAYKDAFKSSKPIQVDLVNRTQKDEPENEERQPLCKKTNEAIERELYRFLRLNNYNVQLIKLELQEISKYYHNAISCIKLKNKRQKAAEAALKDLEAQNQQMPHDDGT
ncbi:hypothetical protein TSAR_011639 [Trichomalopsis sarcophagae]|uniref:Uncharacterized protein n=1 Tax=Trichomalopsis sarcophagae TaxID=543379 RepID=A0A232EPG4_9HYME|nr:hypothetical protein TSAR_011639 [Trichomalopsis sarcophagae]